MWSVRESLRQPVGWLALLALVALPLVASDLRAEELATPADADAICRTSEPLAPFDFVSDPLHTDPLVTARLRHDYVLQRHRRLTEVYSVTLDTSQYRFLPGEPTLLTVDTLSPFTLFGGAFELDLGPAAELAFPVGQAEAEELLAGYASDQTLLRLYFQLSALEDPGLSYCSWVDGTLRIHGYLLGGELVSRPDERRLAWSQTERYSRVQVRLGFELRASVHAPMPAVEVTHLAFPRAAPEPDEAEVLRMEAESRAMPCYVRGLNRNGRLQGAVVVAYEIASDGRVSETTVTIDAVDQSVLTGCVLSALEGIVLPRQHPGQDYPVRMTIVFRLE